MKKLEKLGDVDPSFTYAHFVASNPFLSYSYTLMDYVYLTFFAQNINPHSLNKSRVREELAKLRFSLSGVIDKLDAEGPLMQEVPIINDILFEPYYWTIYSDPYYVREVRPRPSVSRSISCHNPLFHDFLILYLFRDIDLERRREILRYDNLQNSFVTKGISDETFCVLLPHEKIIVKERWMLWKAREEPKYSKGLFVSIDKDGYNTWFEHPRSSSAVYNYYKAFGCVMGFNYKRYEFKYPVEPGIGCVGSLLHDIGRIVERF